MSGGFEGLAEALGFIVLTEDGGVVAVPPATPPEPVSRWAELGPTLANGHRLVSNVILANATGAAELAAVGLELVELAEGAPVAPGDEYDGKDFTPAAKAQKADPLLVTDAGEAVDLKTLKDLLSKA